MKIHTEATEFAASLEHAPVAGYLLPSAPYSELATTDSLKTSSSPQKNLESANKNGDNDNDEKDHCDVVFGSALSEGLTSSSIVFDGALQDVNDVLSQFDAPAVSCIPVLGFPFRLLCFFVPTLTITRRSPRASRRNELRRRSLRRRVAWRQTVALPTNRPLRNRRKSSITLWLSKKRATSPKRSSS